MNGNPVSQLKHWGHLAVVAAVVTVGISLMIYILLQVFKCLNECCKDEKVAPNYNKCRLDIELGDNKN